MGKVLINWYVAGNGYQHKMKLFWDCHESIPPCTIARYLDKKSLCKSKQPSTWLDHSLQAAPKNYSQHFLDSVTTVIVSYDLKKYTQI